MAQAPPLPPRSTRPAQRVPINKSAGHIYPPGQWPTPDLFLSPVGRYRCLAAPSAYTSETIQLALNSLGPSSTLYLPQSSVWIIANPLQLFEYQELSTWGYPTEEKHMALLEATKECHPHVINALKKSGARLRSLIVDGGRERYGYDSQCGVMLQFGHEATDQVIDHCIVRHPRHWSCIQVFEGSQNARVTNNMIGPAGIGADKESGKWADGISYAGSNGLVAGNKIQDATDGAIVVFGAPGTLITSNTIVARERLCLGGINMVDWGPHNGNYVQTRVVHNTIITQSPAGYIKTGIGQGPSVWWTNNPSNQKFNRGAIVSNNLIDFQDVGLGRGFVGYGFAVAEDVRDWVCVGNKSSERVRYQGDVTGSLPVPNVSPGPFVHNVSQARLKVSDSAEVFALVGTGETVTLQSEFSCKRGSIKSLISISPGASRVLAYQPGQFHLKKDSFVHLQGAMLSYESSGAIRVRRRVDGLIDGILWESKAHVQAPTDDEYLTFTSEGKLCVIRSSDSQSLFDFTPHILMDANALSEESVAAVLVLSDIIPHVSVTTQTSSVLFSSAYTFPQNRSFPVGQVVARTYLYNGSMRTLLYTLSPYCQFVVLRSKMADAIIPPLPLVWPLTPQETQWDWEIAWATPNSRTKERRSDAIMYFQGDGNLVIYSQNTVPWASGTHGKSPPATQLRLGVGTDREPWVEIVDSEGRMVWSS